MKKKVFRLLVLIIVALSLANVNVNAYASERKTTTSYKNSTTVRNYSQFYSTLKKGVNVRKSQVSIYAKNYSKSTYNIDKAVKQAVENNFNLKSTVTSYTTRILSTRVRRDKVLNVQLKYTLVDGSASYYSQLLNIVENAAKSKKTTVRVKIKANNTSIINNKFRVKDDANKVLPAAGRIGSVTIRQSGLRGVNELVLTYSLTYKDETKTTTTVSSTTSSYDTLYKTIKDAIYNCNSSVDITLQPNYLNNNFDAIFSTITKVSNVILDNDLDINYLDNENIQAYEENGAVKVTITFSYLYAKDQILQQRTETNNKAQEIINSIITPGMTDFQKEKAIHDYIINNTRYDYDNYEKGTLPDESFSSYGVLVKGVGVCEGYALAVKKLLDLAGVDSIVITGYGDGEAHAWNLVKVGGAYRHVDTTWDDPVYFENGVREDAITYNYFNLTDSEISKDHTWDKTKFPACN